MMKTRNHLCRSQGNPLRESHIDQKWGGLACGIAGVWGSAECKHGPQTEAYPGLNQLMPGTGI